MGDEEAPPAFVGPMRRPPKVAPTDSCPAPHAADCALPARCGGPGPGGEVGAATSRRSGAPPAQRRAAAPPALRGCPVAQQRAAQLAALQPPPAAVEACIGPVKQTLHYSGCASVFT